MTEIQIYLSSARSNRERGGKPPPGCSDSFGQRKLT